jgi:uncharacterized protein YaeQ
MPAVTLYRFRIELSDLDRSVYDSLDFRVAMHPSETNDFLITRVLAYALNWQEGLEFSAGGLHEAEEPAMKVAGRHGTTALSIEIGNPSAKRLHKNAKAADAIKVYTYKDPSLRRRPKIPRPHGRTPRARQFLVAPPPGRPTHLKLRRP